MKSPFSPTEVYGLGYWLKDYGYYPKRMPLYVWMDHGMVLHDDLFPNELETEAPLVFKFSPRLVQAYKKVSHKPVYGLLNPTIHCKNKRGYRQKTDAKGTLFYVAHSTELVEDLTNWNEFIDGLKHIPEKFGPIDICLHPTDIRKGLDKIFLEKGYKVYTAGDAWADSYADNLYNILCNYKYTMSNLPGSYFFYSVEMGIPFSLYGEEPKYFNKGDSNIELGEYDSYKNQSTYQYVLKLFSGFHKEVTPEQKEFVDINLGKYHTVSRLKASFLLYRALFQYILKYPGVVRLFAKDIFKIKKLSQQI
jgi:hypothetical protein